MVAITGQVARPFIGKDAFQETDITGITLPITKHSYLVTSAGELARTVKEAFHIAQTGRPGPVIINLPRDVQQEEAEFTYPDRIHLPGYKPPSMGIQRKSERQWSLLTRLSGPSSLLAEESSFRKLVTSSGSWQRRHRCLWLLPFSASVHFPKTMS